MDAETKTFLKWTGWGILAVFLLVTAFSSIVRINSGHVGVVSTFGKVTDERQPGMSFKIPYLQGITSINVQVQKEQVDASAGTKDLQSVTTRIALNYHPDHARVSDIFVNLSKDYVDRVVAPDIQESVKAVVARYNAEELLTRRSDVANDVTLLLTQKLQPRGVMVDQVSIVNFAFSADFNKAIENKQVAQQQAQQAQYELQSAHLRAQANQAQQAALTNEILEQQAIAKWNGVLPTFVGQGSVFNIPLNK